MPDPTTPSASTEPRDTGHAQDVAADVAADRCDRALLARHLAGDRAALGELVTRHHRRLVALVTRAVPGVDADAVVQDTWATVLAKADTFRGEGSVSGWLSRIARHRALDTARHERRSTTTDPDTLADLTDLTDRAARPDDAGTSSQASADLVAVAGTALPQAWSWLTPEHREVLWLTTVLDLSVDDVAERLNLSPSTVKSRTARARTALRAALAHGRPRPRPRRRTRRPVPATGPRASTPAAPAGPTPRVEQPPLDQALTQLTEEQREAAASFEAALAQLTVGQREAVTAIDLEGLSVSAAAGRAGVNADSMRERWERAHANLRRLQGHGPAAVSTRARRGPTG